MKCILAAVDEDNLANRVIQTTGELAKKLDATVVTCHTFPEDMYEKVQMRLQRDLDQPFTAAQAENRAQAIARTAAEGLDEFGIPHESKGLVGNPACEITLLSKRINASLIVMGFEGLRGLDKLRAIGSVSRAVMEQAHCPVLSVPQKKEAGAFKRILVAVDEDPLTELVVQKASQLAQQLSASLMICHVMPERESAELLEKHSKYSKKHPYDWTQPEEQALNIVKAATQSLKELNVPFEVTGLSGPPVKRILDLVNRWQADALIMGFEGLHGLGKLSAMGSVSRAVMEQSPCPVIIVPASSVPISAEIGA